MRKLAFLLTLAFIFFFFTSMARAEKFYFYKEQGKTLPKGQEYDSKRILGEENGISGGFQIHFNLPKQYWRGDRNEVDLSFGAGVNKTTNDPATYFFFIEDLAVRDEAGRIYPLKIDPNPDALTDAGAAKLPPYRVKVIRQNKSVDGRIKSQYPVEVATGNKTVEVKLLFNASTLPKHLYLDYKFHIRKENGPEEIFQGTIPLELASYNVGWWEKTRW